MTEPVNTQREEDLVEWLKAFDIELKKHWSNPGPGGRHVRCSVALLERASLAFATAASRITFLEGEVEEAKKAETYWKDGWHRQAVELDEAISNVWPNTLRAAGAEARAQAAEAALASIRGGEGGSSVARVDVTPPSGASAETEGH